MTFYYGVDIFLQRVFVRALNDFYFALDCYWSFRNNTYYDASCIMFQFRTNTCNCN